MSTRSATHYELIGLSREASADEIKAAFRTQAQILHPDAGGDTAAFAALSVAHDVLSDPVRRSDYDATLPAAGSTRFSGWSRRESEPSAASELPPRPFESDDETPRRRPVAEADGDDPLVFRGSDSQPTLRRPMSTEDERGDIEIGTVDGAGLRPSEPGKVQADEPQDVVARESGEIDQPAPREGRWSFFGRRNRDEERDDDRQPVADSPRSVESEEEAPFSRRSPRETQDNSRDGRAPFAPAERDTQRSDYDQAGDFAPSKRAAQRDEYDQAGEFAPAGPRLDRRNEDFAGEFAPSERKASRRNDDFAGEFAPSERKASRRNDDFAGEFAPSERKARRRNDDFAGEFAPPERRDRRY